jgi:hypothetical protein
MIMPSEEHGHRTYLHGKTPLHLLFVHRSLQRTDVITGYDEERVCDLPVNVAIVSIRSKACLGGAGSIV